MSEQVIIKPQEGKQELSLNIEADVIFIGGSAGSAKSYTLMMRPLNHLNDSKFDGIFFRRTTVQLNGQGGLWDTALDMYAPFGAKFQQKDLKARFPSGMTLKFSHMQHLKDRLDHQGLQYSAQFWDELTHFEEEQFTYLLSRLRSAAEGDSYVIASMNPDPDSWVLKYVEPYLDEEGYFNEEMLGKVLYFFMVDGSPVFAETAEELVEEYPELAWEYNKNTGKKVYTRPKTFTFVGSTIFDNPILLESNPSYLSELKALPPVEKARLLHGNWYARAEGSNLFKREWLNKLNTIPSGIECRAWDKAATEPSEVERKPDFTACIKMIRTKEDRFVIVGDFGKTTVEENKDGKVIHHGRFRKTVGARDKIIQEQAEHDGTDCVVVFPVDVGQAGKTEFQESSKKLVLGGFRVKADPMPNNKSKATKFHPFASACENGLVDIVESSFPDKKTLEAFYKEVESFDGERSTRERKDDWADCVASAFNYLCKARVVRLVTRNQKHSGTLAEDVLHKQRQESIERIKEMNRSGNNAR